MQDMVYGYEELKNYERNNIRIQTPKSDYTAGETIEIRFPANSLVDLSTFQLHATLELKNNHAADAKNLSPPRLIQSFFEQVQCDSSGVAIENSFNNYNLIFKTLYDCTTDTSVDEGQMAVYGLGGKRDVTSVAKGATVSYDTICDKWIGFLGSASAIYTGRPMLPEFRVQIRLAGNSVIAAPADAHATYILKGVFASIDKFNGEGLLDAMMASVKNNGIVFDNFSNYSATVPRVQFACTSSHLVKVVVVPRTGVAGALADGDAAFFNRSRKNIDNHQLLVGSTLYPTYPAKGGASAYASVMSAFGKNRDISVGSVIKGDYLTAKYLLCYNFEHTGDGALTGIDTKSISQNIVWEAQQGDTTDVRYDVFPIMKSIVMFSDEGIMVQP